MTKNTESSGSSKTLSLRHSWRNELSESTLSPSAKLVGHTLALFMSESGSSCFPSQATLVRKTGLSERTVRSATRELEGKGWLQVEVGNGKTTTHYTAVVPATIAGSESQGGNDCRPGGQLLPPEEVREEDKPSVSNETAPVRANEIVAHYVDAVKELRGQDFVVPKRSIGAVAQNVKKLLDEGIPPAQVAAGVDRMLERGMVAPALLPQFVVEAGLTVKPRSRSTPEHVTPEATLALAKKLREEGR